MVPKGLRGILKQIMMLGFTDEIPYDLVIGKLTREIQKNVIIGPDL